MPVVFDGAEALYSESVSVRLVLSGLLSDLRADAERLWPRLPEPLPDPGRCPRCRTGVLLRRSADWRNAAETYCVACGWMPSSREPTETDEAELRRQGYVGSRKWAT